MSGELWVTETGRRERLLPDFLIEHYSIAADDSRIVFVALDDSGHSPVWIASLDGRAPPRRLVSLDATRVLFDPTGGILFVGGQLETLFLYRVEEDGSGLQKVIPSPVLFIYSVSPDGKGLALFVGNSVYVYPSDGGSPVLICSACGTAGEENRGVTPPLVTWSADGRFLYLHAPPTRQTYAIPLQPGQLLPPLPAAGIPSMEAAADLPGARLIPQQRAYMGPDPSVYAYPRVTTHRNIYSIRVP